MARALETRRIADVMDVSLDELTPGDPSYTPAPTTSTASGFGPTEAPRGALGHWVDIIDGRISRHEAAISTLASLSVVVSSWRVWGSRGRSFAGAIGPAVS